MCVCLLLSNCALRTLVCVCVTATVSVVCCRCTRHSASDLQVHACTTNRNILLTVALGKSLENCKVTQNSH